jgi:hypothetical protein
MILRELVEELRDNILRDRSDQVSGPSDRLWSDRTLVRYINEAHRRFARLSLILRDGTTPQCCQVTLNANTDTYELDPSVLQVISAKFAGQPADLARAGHAALGTYHTPDAYFFDPSSLSSLQPGKVVAFSTDEQLSLDEDGSTSVVSMRVYPQPTLVYLTAPYPSVLNLRVVRMPLNDLTEDDMDAVPEIPRDHHLDMLDWAAYLALRVVDHDAGDNPAAAAFKTTFDQHVKDARDSAMRKMFTPMQWGFGRNGFSWEGN